MKAYWFSDGDGFTENMNNSGMKPAKVGRTHRIDGELTPCERGLHSSPTPFDALGYAFGEILWEVEIPKTAIIHDDDKYVSHTRKYIRKVDLTKACRQFACQCALDVIHLWDAPRVVNEYLVDEAKGIDRSDIRAAASSAASYAASYAVSSAVSYAASCAVSSAASYAARYAASSAARYAASSAARYAASSAARYAASCAVSSAARYAASCAVSSAATKKFKAYFNEIALKALRGKEI